jgi:hypothetical protein
MNVSAEHEVGRPTEHEGEEAIVESDSTLPIDAAVASTPLVDASVTIAHQHPQSCCCCQLCLRDCVTHRVPQASLSHFYVPWGSDRFRDELAGAISRCNYNQRPDNMNALAGNGHTCVACSLPAPALSSHFSAKKGVLCQGMCGWVVPCVSSPVCNQ